MAWDDRIGRRIKLRDLHVLHTVVQLRSMTKAANQLAISVPVVSKAIAEVERVVGVPLLDRSPHGVEPTTYGLALIRRGLAAFDELRQGVKDIEFLSDPATGDVRVASTAPLAASFVARVIDQMSRRYPRMTFHLLVAETGTMTRLLGDRDVDLLIGRRFGPLADDHFDFRALYDNPYVVLAGARSAWVKKRRFAFADLMDEPWVLPSPDSSVGSFFAEGFRRLGLDFPRVPVVAFAYEVRINLLATNRYLTILPESVLEFPAPRSGIKKLPVELPLPRMPIGVFTLKGRTLGPAAQLFIDCARSIAEPLR